MKDPWTFQDGWLILQKRIDGRIVYALFVQHAISDKDVVDMTMHVILKTGLFALEYGEWHTKPENLRTWGNLKIFMKDKCKLKKNTSNAAGQFGVGMSATTDGDYDKKMDEAYAQSMANFSAGHVNTTSTTSRWQDTIAKQHQQLVMMQQHMAVNAYAAPPQYAAPAQANNNYQNNNNNGGWTGQNHGRQKKKGRSNQNHWNGYEASGDSPTNSTGSTGGRGRAKKRRQQKWKTILLDSWRGLQP